LCPKERHHTDLVVNTYWLTCTYRKYVKTNDLDVSSLAQIVLVNLGPVFLKSVTWWWFATCLLFLYLCLRFIIRLKQQMENRSKLWRLKNIKTLCILFMNICFHHLNLVLVPKGKKKAVVCLKHTFKRGERENVLIYMLTWFKWKNRI